MITNFACRLRWIMACLLVWEHEWELVYAGNVLNYVFLDVLVSNRYGLLCYQPFTFTPLVYYDSQWTSDWNGKQRRQTRQCSCQNIQDDRRHLSNYQMFKARVQRYEKMFQKHVVMFKKLVGGRELGHWSVRTCWIVRVTGNLYIASIFHYRTIVNIILLIEIICFSCLLC